jgi:hypothetical protein
MSERACQLLSCLMEGCPARRQQFLSWRSLIRGMVGLVEQGSRGHVAGPHAARVIYDLFDPADPSHDAAAAAQILVTTPGAVTALVGLLSALSRRGRDRLSQCVPCLGALFFLLAADAPRTAALQALALPELPDALLRVAGSPPPSARTGIEPCTSMASMRCAALPKAVDASQSKNLQGA